MQGAWCICWFGIPVCKFCVVKKFLNAVSPGKNTMPELIQAIYIIEELIKNFNLDNIFQQKEGEIIFNIEKYAAFRKNRVIKNKIN